MPAARAPIGARQIAGRGIVDYVPSNTPPPDLTWAQNLRPTNDPDFVARQWGFHINTNAEAELDTTNNSDSPTTLYGTDSPFAILGDLFARSFGLQGDSTPQTQYVPLSGGSSGGSNAGLLIAVLLLAVGGAYYFFVYRKHSGAN